MTSAYKIFALLCVITAISACSGSGGDGTTSLLPNLVNNSEDNDLDNTRAYKSDGPYANILAPCARAGDTSDDSPLAACSFDTLPLLGMDHENPSISEVMDRVVVSHDWMGQRLEQVLEVSPPEILKLFRGVTAIVIDDDIRPAYYSPNTAAIYLDPAYLWLTITDKATINTKEDFRSGFSDPLDFRSVWRYVSGNQLAYTFGNLEDTSERQIGDIRILLGALLLHELAHANDFFPPASYDFINTSQTPGSATAGVAHLRVSNRLTNDDPLSSAIMFGLGGVMFRGDAPTQTEATYTPVQVGNEFEGDSAADDYAYSSQFEDTAMLFEEAMMKHLYNVDREVAFTDAPPANQNFCNFYLIRWGQRNRIGDTDVKSRAQFVVSEILESSDYDLFFQNLAPPSFLNNGIDFCSMNIGAANGKAAAVEVSTKEAQAEKVLEDIPYL